jgi:dolichol-phosphate mannosyltransferase
MTAQQQTSTDRRAGVSVVIPAKDEAGSIECLIDEIAAVLDGLAEYQVIVVDDGSLDTADGLLRRLMATRPWLRAWRHAVSCGKSAAIRTGVIAADYPTIVTLDGDGQNDPAYIAPLLAALQSDPRVALVAGQRTRRGDSGWKKFQSRIGNWVRGKLLKDGTRDSVCGLKAFRRDVFLALPYFDTMHRFLPALVRREGYEIRHVDVVDRPREHGRSHYGMWDRLLIGIPDLAGVWWLVRRRRRVPQVSEVTRNAD